jgi:hypothetical protein
VRPSDDVFLNDTNAFRRFVEEKVSTSVRRSRPRGR